MAKRIFRIGKRSNKYFAAFTGNEAMNRRTFLKRAGAGVAGLAVAPAALAAGVKAAKQDPTPVVFAKGDFQLFTDYSSSTLTLRVTNTDGDNTNFNRVFGSLTDNHTQKTTHGRVVALFDVPDKQVQRVIVQTFDGNNLVDTGDKKVFEFVKKFVDSPFNKSDIRIVRTLR